MIVSIRYLNVSRQKLREIKRCDFARTNISYERIARGWTRFDDDDDDNDEETKIRIHITDDFYPLDFILLLRET